MLLLRLATRNLFRQAKRNILSMISIILGVFIIILGNGFALGLNENAIRGQIDSVSGHVLVLPNEYPTSGFRHPVAKAYNIDPATRKWLDDSSKTWTARLIAMPRAIKGNESMKVRMIGVSENDENVFPRSMWDIEGRFPKTNQTRRTPKFENRRCPNIGVSNGRWRDECNAIRGERNCFDQKPDD